VNNYISKSSKTIMRRTLAVTDADNGAPKRSSIPPVGSGLEADGATAAGGGANGDTATGAVLGPSSLLESYSLLLSSPPTSGEALRCQRQSHHKRSMKLYIQKGTAHKDK